MQKPGEKLSVTPTNPPEKEWDAFYEIVKPKQNCERVQKQIEILNKMR